VKGMPLFGPNIKKMKEQRDLQGLLRELQNKKCEVRFEVVDALKELKEKNGLIEALKNDILGVRIKAAEALIEIGNSEGMNYATDFFVKMLKYGRFEEKIEAIARICGHGNPLFLALTISNEWLAKSLEKRKEKIPLEMVRAQLLSETSKEGTNPLVRWYALIALVELGDRSEEVIDELIEFSDKFVTFCEREASEYGFSPLTIAFLPESIKEETLRALSYFKGNSKAIKAVVSASEGSFLAGSSKGEPSIDDKRIIYTMGALGDISLRERLEYVATYGKGDAQNAAKIALELFGKATYDEIKARAEQKG
jgi:hypothetical protein